MAAARACTESSGTTTAQPHDLDRVGKSRPDKMEAADDRQGMGKHIGRKEKGASRVEPGIAARQRHARDQSPARHHRERQGHEARRQVTLASGSSRRCAITGA